MVLANTAILNDKKKSDDQEFSNAARRGNTVFASPARIGDTTLSGRPANASSPEAADQDPILDYAAFVLDQEAEYCQQ